MPQDSLQHIGIMGMHWGIRKNEGSTGIRVGGIKVQHPKGMIKVQPPKEKTTLKQSKKLVDMVLVQNFVIKHQKVLFGISLSMVALSAIGLYKGSDIANHISPFDKNYGKYG